MAARIIFEDYRGARLGHVDFDGKELHPSEGVKSFTENYTVDNGVSPEEFVQRFSDYKGGHLYAKLVDSEDDTDELG